MTILMNRSTLKKLLFLRDVAVLSITAFGGAHAHLAILLRDFVHKRAYINENELIELNAFTQILPGPSTTQTVIGIAYKVGGISLAIITFFLWIFPAAFAMTIFAILYTNQGLTTGVNHILTFVQPIVVGAVAYASFKLARKIITSQVSLFLALGAIIATLILRTAFVFPILILLGGIISSALETNLEESQLRIRLFSNINKGKFFYFLGILLVFAGLGAIINHTSPFSLPIRLFENFYRNGIIIFGGGQVLVPLMFTEFVEMKHYVSSSEFLAGYAVQQMLPGPTFSFTSFLGAVTMKNAGGGIGSQLLGAFVATMGINLPGAILVLFFVPFWTDLKKIAGIKNSLSGISAVAVGFMVAAFLLLVKPFMMDIQSMVLVTISFLVLYFTSIRTPWVILAGVLLGLYF